VQAISNSPIWNSTAIFVVEDDSQDGPDHVDAHRQTAFVISPWIKQASIDHQFHNTTGILRTMEMILGLPPLTSPSRQRLGLILKFECVHRKTPGRTQLSSPVK